jgi:hypothetical protein
MVLTKDELVSSLHSEIRILLHLISKVEPSMLDYRPTAKQRSMIELLRYLTMMAPIHLDGVMAKSFDMASWGALWPAREAVAAALDLEGIKRAIAEQSALFTQVLGPCPDAYLREEIEMFGTKSSRGAKLVSLVLCHYSAYRMQLFQYLKSCGREELNTMNLWAGVDGKM